MSAADPMPAIQTSWGRTPFYATGEEWDDRRGEVVEALEYMGTGWIVCCLRHERTTDVWDEEAAVETVALSPNMWCDGCEEEWAAWERRQPPLEPTDADADRHRELARMRRR